MSEDQSESPKPNRRRFMQVFGGALAAAAVTSGKDPLINTISEWGKPKDPTITKEMLIQAGLQDFIPFYQVVTEIHQSYASFPSYSVSRSNPAFDLYSSIESTARGNKDIIASRLKEGWGEKKDQAVAQALEKVQVTTIEIDKGLKDTPQSAKKAYEKFAEVVPGLVMTAPSMLRITNGGGYLDPYSTIRDGNKIPAKIAIESPAHSLEGFFRSGLHELVHSGARWDELKYYVDKTQYLNYLTIEAKAIKQVLDAYFDSPWEEVEKIKGSIGLVPEHLCYELDRTIRLETQIQKVYGLDINSQAQLTEEQLNNKEYRFNRLVWILGRHRKSIKEAEKNGQKLTNFQSDFLRDFNIGLVLDLAVDDLHHFFIGPVQREGGGLPGEGLTPENPDALITELNKKIQLARLRAISTLSEKELDSFETAAQALRDRLGLS